MKRAELPPYNGEIFAADRRALRSQVAELRAEVAELRHLLSVAAEVARERAEKIAELEKDIEHYLDKLADYYA